MRKVYAIGHINIWASLFRIYLTLHVFKIRVLDNFMGLAYFIILLTTRYGLIKYNNAILGSKQDTKVLAKLVEDGRRQWKYLN